MKIAVLHPNLCKKSATELAKELGGVAINPFQFDTRDYTQYDLVFNYGCNRQIKAKKIINKTSSVARCVDKIATFYRLSKMGVPVVPFTELGKEVPAHWKTVVCRKNADGAGGKGLTYVEQAAGQPIPASSLYTEYYDHKFEFRIVVFKNKVAGRYLKRENKKGEWVLDHMQPKGFEEMDGHCELASKLLDIDYVGFDVLAKSQKDYRILEANSGPILSPEIIDIIKDSINV